MSNARVPNLLHFCIFLGIGFFAFVLCQALAFALPHSMQSSSAVLALALAEVLTLAAAWLAFPILWLQPFFSGIHWNFARAPRRIASLGLVLGFAGQGISLLIPHPKELPIEKAFDDPSSIWLMVVFGVIVGPLFEEVLFRGFLLPGIANAVDSMRIPRDPDPQTALENLIAWQTSSGWSRVALVVASTVTSLLFALIHAPQLGYTWAAVALLAAFSLVLCIVRIRTGSVAASTVVHMCYNLSIFLTMFYITGGFRHMDAA